VGVARLISPIYRRPRRGHLPCSSADPNNTPHCFWRVPDTRLGCTTVWSEVLELAFYTFYIVFYCPQNPINGDKVHQHVYWIHCLTTHLHHICIVLRWMLRTGIPNNHRGKAACRPVQRGKNHLIHSFMAWNSYSGKSGKPAIDPFPLLPAYSSDNYALRRDSSSNRGRDSWSFDLDPTKYRCSFHTDHAVWGSSADQWYSHSYPSGSEDGSWSLNFCHIMRSCHQVSIMSPGDIS